MLTPYQKAGEDKVVRFFEGLGFEVVAVGGVQAPGPVEMADLSPRVVRDALIRLDDPAVEAIVQLGTNLPMARLAAVGAGARRGRGSRQQIRRCLNLGLEADNNEALSKTSQKRHDSKRYFLFAKGIVPLIPKL